MFHKLNFYWADIPRLAGCCSTLLWGAKAPVVANIAHSQWCLEQLFVQTRGEDNSLFTKNIITYMHRSNNSSPYPMFERLFAVIWLCLVCLRSWCNYKRVCIALTYPQPLSVTDIKDITFVGRIAMVILKKKPAPLKSQCLSEHLQERVRKLVQMSEWKFTCTQSECSRGCAKRECLP